MASGDHSDQLACWNGSQGDGWVAAQRQIDATLAPLTDVLVNAAEVTLTDRVLDIGCGCGSTSLRLGRTAEYVLGVDISQQMLDQAMQQSAGVSNVEFVLADAGEHVFEPSFHLLFSRFGSMFFSDPVAAFSSLRNALHPDGRLCLICWNKPAENPWLAVPSRTAMRFLPEAPPPNPTDPGPFAFADPAYVRSILESAGFRDLSIASIDTPLRVGNSVDDAMELVTNILGPPRRLIEELDGEDQRAALDALREAFAGHQSGGKIDMDASAWLVTGQAH